MKKYYKDLNLIRFLSCVAVILYHLNIIKGGFLAVCTFFVLSGYLSCVSALKKEKFSFKDYYWNKIKHLYMPLLIVVFITIGVVSLIPSINWINLKPESTSVLLNYNNFWQLNANLDYFTRHVDSPFMHFWYISILLQFDLVFPLIFLILKKIGDKISKILPTILTFVVGIVSIWYFHKCNSENIMVAYYHTFARSFSIFFGLSIGFLHYYYSSLTTRKEKHKIVSKIIFCLLLTALTALIVVGDAESKMFELYMISATVVSTLLISYAVVDQSKLNIFDKIIKFLSDLTYEIYLVQYPVIFIFEDIEMSSGLKLTLIIAITIVVSYILHLAIHIKKDAKVKIARYLLLLLTLIATSYGIYEYVIAVDHTEEMKMLEEQLAQNQKLMEEQQAEYEAKLAEEKEKWKKMMEDLENGEADLEKLVTEMPMAAIGDSVMLGAQINLTNKFKNLYFDAEISRTCYVVNDILKQLIRKDALGDVIVLNFGANGDCSEATKDAILKTIGDRKLFWLTVTNDKRVHFNDKIKAYAAKHDNMYIIDWEEISKGHKEYFYSDGLHLPTPGRIAYTEAIYNAIYQVYLDEFNAKKEAILKQHEEEMKTKISFYGNEVLINVFEYLKDEFKDSNFTFNKDFTYEELKAELEKNIADDNFTNRIVFAFDKTLSMSKEEYQSIIDLCKNHDIYVVNMSKEKLELENAKIIDFSDASYLMADKVHLTSEGNKKLSENLIEILKENEE